MAKNIRLLLLKAKYFTPYEFLFKLSEFSNFLENKGFERNKWHS